MFCIVMVCKQIVLTLKHKGFLHFEWPFIHEIDASKADK